MDFHEKMTLWGLMDEEKNNSNTPTPARLSYSDPRTLSNRETPDPLHRMSSASSAVVRPMSPETPWMLSPVRTSPSQPILYHCLASLHRSEGSILSLAVSKDLIFTGTKSRRIHAWKQPDCAEAGHINAGSGDVRAILVHGRIVFTTHEDRRVRIWGVTGSTEGFFRQRKIATIPKRSSVLGFSRKSPNQHKDHISCIAHNNEEKLLYTGSWDRTVKAWNIPEKRCVDSFVAHEGHINAIVVNQDDGCVFTCSTDGSVKIWRRVFGENSHILTVTLRFQLSPVNALALSGSILYSGSSDGLINFWEKEKTSGRFNHRGFLQGHHFAVLCLSTVEDLIFSGSEDATIRVWRREEGNGFHSCLAVMEGHSGPVRCLAASLERESTVVKGLLVYSASLDQTFKVWRVKVYPNEKASHQGSGVEDQSGDKVEFEMSPVLSPSWVVKKLQV